MREVTTGFLLSVAVPVVAAATAAPSLLDKPGAGFAVAGFAFVAFGLTSLAAVCEAIVLNWPVLAAEAVALRLLGPPRP